MGFLLCYKKKVEEEEKEDNKNCWYTDIHVGISQGVLTKQPERQLQENCSTSGKQIRKEIATWKMH